MLPPSVKSRSFSDGGLRYRRTLRLSGRRTSVMLETAFWEAIALLARQAAQSEETYLTAIAETSPIPGQSLAGRIRTRVTYDLMSLAALDSDDRTLPE